MKTRLQQILNKIGLPSKLRKAALEDAIWVYPLKWQGFGRTSSFIITEEDFAQSNQWLTEYIKCVCDMDFDAKILSLS